MKNVLTSPKIYMLACLLVIVVTASAWQLKTKKQPRGTTSYGNAATADTTHPRKHNTDEDDYGLSALDESLKQIDLNLKNMDFNFKGLDTIINNSVKLALDNIDFAKINAQTKEALDKIDWPQLKITIDNSIREAQKQVKAIDWDKIRTEIKDATDKINSEEFKKQFDGAKLQQTINDAMEKATEGLEAAKTELKAWNDFVNGLEKDGLIDKKKGYKIEWNDDGELYINGTKQSKEISDKYHQYYKKGGYTIKHDGDETESL